MPVVLAHGSHQLIAVAWRRWEWEPVPVSVILAASVLYGLGLVHLYRRTGTGRGVRRWEPLSFYAGLFTIALAILSPVAWLAEQSLSFHMIQHALLMAVAPPLLVLGRPIVLFIWSVPRRWRTPLAHRPESAMFLRIWRVLTMPLAVLVLYAVALWLWHVPAFYDAAVTDERLHIVEHACFLFSATLFWWTMLHGRFGQFGYGVAVLCVFLTAMHSGLLGALLTFQPTLVYRAYDGPARAWGLNPLADQQLAGLLMWVPFGVLFIVLGLGLLAAWIGQSSRRAMT
jgi:putative membrane protein